MNFNLLDVVEVRTEETEETDETSMFKWRQECPCSEIETRILGILYG